MINQIENCQSCPLLEYDGEGYGTCQHPNSTLKTEHFNVFPDNKIHEKCPLKVVDLILTVRK